MSEQVFFVLKKHYEGSNYEATVGEFSSLEKAKRYMEQLKDVYTNRGVKLTHIVGLNEFRFGKIRDRIHYRIAEETRHLDPEFDADSFYFEIENSFFLSL